VEQILASVLMQLDPLRGTPPCHGLGFMGRRFEFHGTIFVPWRSLSSTVDANAFGPGMPGATPKWNDHQQDRHFLYAWHRFSSITLPGVPVRITSACSPSSGFGVDYPANTDFSNPILTPQAPERIWIWFVSGQDYMLVHSTCWSGANSSLSGSPSGFSAVPSFSMLQVNPGAVFPRPVSEGSTMAVLPSRRETTRPSFGGGFNVGVHYAFERLSPRCLVPLACLVPKLQLEA